MLVTGSSGLIGRAVIPRLSPPHTVLGLDRDPPPHPPPQAECICVDLSSTKRVEQAMERVRTAHGTRIASLVHLAAYYGFSGRPSPLYEEVTVQGTKRLLDALADLDVEQVVFSSTMLVHAPTTPGHPITEDAPLEPTWDYPESKVVTEDLLRRGHGDAQLTILRIAGVYDDQGHSPPLSHQVQRIHEGQLTSRFYPGDPRRGQAFVHLEDVVEAIRLAVERRDRLPAEAAILVGEERTLSYQELHRTIGQSLHGRPRPLHRIPKPLAKAGARAMDLVGEPFIRPWMVDRADDHYELDVSRARDLLGWAPRHSLEGTLPRILEHLVEDPLAWYRENRLKPPAPLRRTQKTRHGGNGG